MFEKDIQNLKIIKSKKSKNYVPNQVLIGFQSGVNESQKKRIRQEIGGKLLKKIEAVNVEKWGLPKDLSVKKAIKILEDKDQIKYAEPNYLYHPCSTEPLHTPHPSMKKKKTIASQTQTKNKQHPSTKKKKTIASQTQKETDTTQIFQNYWPYLTVGGIILIYLTIKS